MSRIKKQYREYLSNKDNRMIIRFILKINNKMKRIHRSIFQKIRIFFCYVIKEKDNRYKFDFSDREMILIFFWSNKYENRNNENFRKTVDISFSF